MTAMTHEPLTEAEGLLNVFLALDTPEGFRAELIEGDIVVTPPTDGDHERYISRIVRQIMQRSRADMDFSGYKGLTLPGRDRKPWDHVIPDGTFAPCHLDLFRGAEPWMPCDGVALVVEVTSSRARRDREDKRQAYARGAIPLYLLVDREAAALTLFSQPEAGDYREHCTVLFGKPLPLPAPFAFDLETTDFV